MNKNDYVVNGEPRFADEFMDDVIDEVNSIPLKSKDVDYVSYDADNVTHTCARLASGVTTNIPVSTWGILLTFKVDNSRAVQYFTTQNSTRLALYSRVRWDGTFHPWKEIYSG